MSNKYGFKTYIKSRADKVGKSPGTLVYIGSRKVEKPTIKVIEYNIDSYSETIIEDPSDCSKYINTESVTWIDIEGINSDIIDKIGDCFKIHSLVKEDILNTDQRPKMEVYDKYAYIVIKMLHFDKKELSITPEQVSIILSGNTIISFQEGLEGDNFESIRNRLKTEHGKIRKLQSDYLVYTLIDSIVDVYFTILEEYGEKIEQLEVMLIERPSQTGLGEIHRLKREMIMLRKSIWPLREVISRMEKDDDFFKETIKPYIRDVYDHTIHIIDTVETFRDMLSGILDIYLSSVSNRINEVMKVLTIITTIFIPLSFIAGIYGMNFNTAYKLNMPELNWQYGYIAVLSLMAVIALSLLYYFKRKKWM